MIYLNMLPFFGFLIGILSVTRSSSTPLDSCSSPGGSDTIAKSHVSFRDCLHSELGRLDSFSSKIVFPGDLSYPLSTLTYNLAIQHNSSAIVYVSTAKEVSEAIQCASQFRIPVVARTGGHSYASFSSSPRGLIIDVTNLRDFSFATNHVGEVGETVTFGAGLRLGDLDMALQEHERAIPHGVCPYVGGQWFLTGRHNQFYFNSHPPSYHPFLGVSGHATCGGFGPTSRMWGLFSDHLVELEVVTANGTILKASEKTNPDLFFAMRGAGPSFGIITSLTLRTHQSPRSVILFEINYQFPNPDVAAATLYHFQSWGLKSAPSQLGMRWSVKLNQTALNQTALNQTALNQTALNQTALNQTALNQTALNQTANGATSIVLDWKLRGSFLGHMARFNRTINKLTSGFRVKGEVVNLERLDWLESVRAFGGDKALSSEGVNPSNNNASYYAKSFVVRDVNPMAYSQWTTFTKKLYGIASGIKASQRLDWFLEIDLVGGRYQGQETGVRGSGSKTSSFGPRDALLLFQMGGYGPKGASLDYGGLMDLTRETSNQVYDSLGGGRKELTGFNCYVDSEFSADRAHWEYFGQKNSGILKDLKRVWDPSRVFSHPHSF